MTEILLYSEINILGIAVLLILAYDIKKSEFNKGLRPRVMLKYIAGVTSFYLFDVLGKIIRLKNWDLPNLVVWAILILYFMCFAISAYYWFIYSEILHNRQFLNTVRRKLAVIPVILLAILFVISYFNGLVFYVDAEGIYHRGKLFFVQSIISYGYIFTAGVMCLYHKRKENNASTKRNLQNFALYSFVTLAFGVMQFHMGSFPLLIIGNTLSILVIYLDYNSSMISKDPLTEIPNRRKLMHYLEESKQRLKSDENLWFVFTDIDYFKHINDRYGHIEGDRILKEFTIIIKEFCRENKCFCARYGGDEFALVQILNQNQSFSVPEKLKKAIEEQHILVNNMHVLSASIGYTKFSPTDRTLDDMIRRADQEMYRAKMEKTPIFGGGGVNSPPNYYS